MISKLIKSKDLIESPKIPCMEANICSAANGVLSFSLGTKICIIKGLRTSSNTSTSSFDFPPITKIKATKTKDAKRSINITAAIVITYYCTAQKEYLEDTFKKNIPLEYPYQV